MQGRYKILSRVAAGAMGVVYRGERVELGRPVAVKFLHPWVASQQAFRSRFETEARAMSRLSHPNCVSVIDFGLEGAPYLVMDFVTGSTLRELLEQGRLAPARAVGFARQLLAAMSHAHAQGIIHRDLKPENLLLSETAGLGEQLRVLDFGLAKLRDGPAMTAGLAVGTPSYMSPEQAGGDGEIDARTDVYAVGVLLFEMLAGRKPFVADTVAEVLVMHRDAPPPSLRKLVPEAGISRELEGVVVRAMAKLQPDRFQSAEEFAAALAAVPEASLTVAPSRAVAGKQQAPLGKQPAAASLKQPPVALAKPQPAGDERATRVVPPSPSLAGGETGRASGAVEADATIVDPLSGRLLAGAPAGSTAVDGGASESRAAVRRVPRSRSGGAPIIAIVGVTTLALVIIAIVVLRTQRKVAVEQAPPRPPISAGSSRPAANATATPPKSPAASPSGVAPGGGPPSPSSASPPAKPETGVAETQRADEQTRFAEADRLVAAGHWEQALTVLEQARRDDPKSAEAAYRYAVVALDNGRWAQGVTAARVAARRDPTLRGDERLVRGVIRALSADPVAERSQETLRAFGTPATPFIQHAAKNDGDPKVRSRARELLASRGSSMSRGPSGGSRSSSSSSAIFRR